MFFLPKFEINKKRDTELTKLRKLLEDVHIESEETAHLLRKKHQEVVADFQEQLDQLAKAKARYSYYIWKYKHTNAHVCVYIKFTYIIFLFSGPKKKKPNSNKKCMNF